MQQGPPGHWRGGGRPKHAQYAPPDDGLEQRLRKVVDTRDAVTDCSHAMLQRTENRAHCMRVWKNVFQDAVVERNAGKALVLLYVANDVLQCPRNGYRWQEDFGPHLCNVLPSALACARSIRAHDVHLKMTRLPNIWRERRVLVQKDAERLVDDCYDSTTELESGQHPNSLHLPGDQPNQRISQQPANQLPRHPAPHHPTDPHPHSHQHPPPYYPSHHPPRHTASEPSQHPPHSHGAPPTSTTQHHSSSSNLHGAALSQQPTPQQQQHHPLPSHPPLPAQPPLNQKHANVPPTPAPAQSNAPAPAQFSSSLAAHPHTNVMPVVPDPNAAAQQVELDQALFDLEEAAGLLRLVKKTILERKLQVFEQTHSGVSCVSSWPVMSLLCKFLLFLLWNLGWACGSP